MPPAHASSLSPSLRGGAPLPSEVELRELVGSLPDMVFRYSFTSRSFSYVSPAVFNLLGYSPDEFYADPELWLKIVYPEDRNILQSLLEHPERFEVPPPLRFIRKDGEVIWMEQRNTLIRDEQGRIDAFQGVMRDITLRHRKEEELKEGEERARNLIQHAPMVIYEIAFDGNKLKSVNDAACLLSGYTRQELLAMKPLDIVEDESRTLFRERVRKKMAGEEADESVEYTIRTKDGRKISLVMNTGEISYRDGKPESFVIIAYDISERKWAEEQLANARAEAEHRTAEVEGVLASLNDIVLIYDPDRNVLETNPSFLATFKFDPVGVNLKDLVERVSCRLLDGRPLQLEDQPTPRALRGEMVVGARFLVKKPDGADIIVETSSGPLRIEGRVVGSVTVWHDITELERTLEQVEESKSVLDALMEYVPEGISIADAPDARIRMVSRFGQELLGRSHEGLTAEQVTAQWKVYHKDGVTLMADAELPLMRALQKGETLINEEIAQINEQGHKLTLSCNAAPILGRTGAIVGGIVAWRDVTDLRQAEEELESAARFPSENPNPVLRIGQGGILLYANQASDVFMPNWRLERGKPVPAKWLEVTTRALTGGTAADLEQAHGQRVFSFYVVPIVKAGYVNLYGQDITERKRAGAELQKFNRTLRALSNTNQALLRASEESDYLHEVCQIILEDCGHAMAWVGYAENDEGKSIRPVAHAGFEEGYLETLNLTWADTERGRGPTGTAIRTGQVSLCRNMLTDPQFAPWREEALRRGYRSSIVFPMVDEGRAFGALTIYSRDPDPFSEAEVKLLAELTSDLTYGVSVLRLRAARAQAEQSLRESEERFSKAFYASPVGVNLFRIGDGRCVDVNDAYLSLIGYSREEVIGHTASELNLLVNPESRAIWMQEAQEQGSARNVDVSIRRKSGEVANALFSLVTIELEGEAMGLTLAIDITDRKRAEGEREGLLRREQSARAEAEAAVRIRDHFITLASHELKTPLTALKGYVELLMERTAATDLEQNERMVRIIHQQTVRLEKMISGLLDISRIERGQFSLEVVPVDLDGLVTSIVREIEPTLRRHRLYFVSAAEKLIVNGDETRLEQVVQNLVQNAIKYSPAGGRVRVRLTREGATARIAVRDEGIGIPAAALPRLFALFYRADNAETNHIGGLGIGLYVAREIVRLHGGDITVDTEERMGSEFTISLPLMPSPG